LNDAWVANAADAQVAVIAFASAPLKEFSNLAWVNEKDPTTRDESDWGTSVVTSSGKKQKLNCLEGGECPFVPEL
jgi:hypothetical protein